MVLIFVLVGLALVAVPIVLIILVIDFRALRRRVTALEDQLEHRRAAGPDLPAAAPKARGPEPAAPEPAAASRAAPRPTTLAGPATARVASEPAAAPPPPRPSEPKGPSGFDRALAWLRENWFYAISAISLGLAGIFLVQYGIETGLLTPTMRVLAALGLGAALVAAGESIRRRAGDGEDSATAYLPSTFSAAGIVVLYAAILAARGLYGLIGPEVAFAGLVVVSGTALVFGWFYGPFLAAAGLTGAAAAPFLVGGSADSGTLFYLYYGLLGATGLAIDALRRWGWVSSLALTLAYALGTTVFAQGGEFAGHAALLAWLALAAIAVPRFELWPAHPGWTVLESSLRRHRDGEAGVIPPTWIAAGAVTASTALLVLAASSPSAGETVLALFVLALLALALILWASDARGLSDLALLPAAAILLVVLDEAGRHGALYADFIGWNPAEHPETTPPLTATLLLGLATLISVAAAWRSFRGPWAAAWAAAAAVFAPAMAVLLELFWTPAPVIGGYFWAGHAIVLAALMTLLAERFARADGAGRRAAYATLSALTLIALALFILLAEAALTVALSVLIVAAAALDRRFRLPEMHWFHLAGVATLGWRLILDPGLASYLDRAPLWEVLLAFGAALAGLGAGLALLPANRLRVRALLESAIWAYGGTLISILLFRAIDRASTAPGTGVDTHWAMALFGMIWTALALAQIYRLRQTAELRWLRIALALGYGGLAVLAFLMVLTIHNPFFGINDVVLGLQPLDTLTVAYALPAAVFAALAMRAHWLPRRRALLWLAGLFAVLWAFLEIRWFWQGDRIGSGTFSQPELYTYTVALLLTGGLLLYQAIARRSRGLRRLAIAVIALSVAKVFLIDAPGLSGLLRVFSFLALGLVLAGLAWLNRWAAERQNEAPAP